MIAPFPWFGGKSQAAELIWSRFGDVRNYVEPFFGSGAVLLARPHWDEELGNWRDDKTRTETVNDKDALLTNFWRAVRDDPELVAYWADWQVNEAELHARHSYLVANRGDVADHLAGDPDWYDPQLAGYWVYGACLWIGGGWCSGRGPWRTVDGRLVKVGKGEGQQKKELPHLGDDGTGVHRKLVHLGDDGRGMNRRPRRNAEGEEGLARQLPHLGDDGRGIHRQVLHLGNDGTGVHRKLPHLGTDGSGVNRQLPSVGDDGTGVHRKLPHLFRYGRGVHAGHPEAGLGQGEAWAEHVLAMMVALSDRLRRVRVACGEWDRILGPTPTTRFGLTGVLLDPPYSREADWFEGAYAEEDLTVAHKAAAWAAEHGADPLLRIALCGYDGEHEMPEGWERVAWKNRGGYGNQGTGRGSENRHREVIWFSPHCLKEEGPERLI